MQKVLRMAIVTLKKIINEMIMLAKLDSNESIYEETNVYVSELIQSTVDRALPIAKEQEVTINYSIKDDDVIRVDQERMLQAMLNIVTNAIRHANEEVTIQVVINEEIGRAHV